MLEDVQVPVVHPNKVKWSTESRGRTDQVDARKLAELARAGIPPRAVHVVEGPVRELRELVSARQHLQAKRAALINAIRGYVYQEGASLAGAVFCGGHVGDQAGPAPVSALDDARRFEAQQTVVHAGTLAPMS